MSITMGRSNTFSTTLGFTNSLAATSFKEIWQQGGLAADSLVDISLAAFSFKVARQQGGLATTAFKVVWQQGGLAAASLVEIALTAFSFKVAWQQGRVAVISLAATVLVAADMLDRSIGGLKVVRVVIVICKIYFPNILNVSQFKLQTCVTLDLGQQGHGLQGSKLYISLVKKKKIGFEV